MHKLRLPWLRLLFVVAVHAICAVTLTATDEPTLSKEQIKQFLLTAKVVDKRPVHTGVTSTFRLTLTDGTLTHYAHFQPVEEHKPAMKFADGRTETNFVDSYKYNIAAYALAELIGFDDMMPVYVERKVDGKAGSVSWWLPWKMDDAQRMKQKLEPPDKDSWNNQMYKIRVFDNLVYDTDPNLTNVLIGEDWKLWRIDFSRAFRTSKDVKDPKDLVRCDRQLFERLKALNANDLTEKTKGYLTKDEVKSVMARRDKIVERFQKLIAEKGENEVLY
ncbi:MAG: hypothetical protein QOG55_1414 [Acidobacteriaceae bacterium]|jgi:hypothetical protein|nr:hypothetical protein [Acidobacteriaceae bacterium]